MPASARYATAAALLAARFARARRRHHHLRWRLLLLLCIAATGLQAQTVPVVELRGGVQAIALEGRIGHFSDAGGTLEIADLRALGAPDRFRVPQATIRAAAQAAPQWFKLRLRSGNARGDWVLALTAAQGVHDLRIHGPYREAGPAPSLSPSTATDAPQDLSAARLDRHALLISLPAPGTYSVYLRAQARLPQSYAMAIRDLAGFSTERQTARLLDGVGYGLTLGLLLFALLLWWVFREPVYLSFLADSAAALGTLALFNGDAAQYLLDGAPEWNDRLLLATLPLWGAFALRRAHRYLSLAEHVPRIARVVRASAALCVIAALGALAGLLVAPSLLTVLATALGLLLLPIGLRPSPKFGYRFSVWYLLTHGWICALVVMKTADLWALMPSWLNRYQVFQLTVLALCLVFAALYGARLSRVWMKQGVLRARTAELARVAETDSLTGLANRAGFERRAETLLREEGAWALLVIDLDRFKPINDRFGHPVGDELLRAVAGRLRDGVGPNDQAARLGGDEFALLLAGRHDRDVLAGFARRLIESIGAPVEVRGRAHQVGASVGIARFPDHGEDLSHLLRRADLALYRAKDERCAGFAFFDDLPPHTSTSASLS